MIIQKLEMIGQGANSKVYLGEYETAISQNRVALKEFKGDSNYKIKKTLEIYSKIKKEGIPTLAFCTKGKIQGEEYLIMENINSDPEYIYVSHNSIINGVDCKAEIDRKKNKLQEIINLNTFLETAKKNLLKYSRANVSLYYDSYFFGSQNYPVSELSYKIVDMDNIEFWDSYTANNFETNLSNFKEAIMGFVEHFVTEKYKLEYSGH